MVGAVAALGPAVGAHADPPDEAYPPRPTVAPDRPPSQGGGGGQIPATGNDGSPTWMTVGAGALLAGTVLLTAARRRATSVAS